MTADVEISDDMFIITRETAEAYLNRHASQHRCPPQRQILPVDTAYRRPSSGNSDSTTNGYQRPSTASGLTWTGDVPPQKWMNFYTKVLSKFASSRGLKLTLKVEVAPEGGLSKQKLDETKSALRELGLNDDVSPT